MSIYANGDGLLMKAEYRAGTSAPINRVGIGKVDIKKSSVVHSTSEAFLSNSWWAQQDSNLRPMDYESIF